MQWWRVVGAIGRLMMRAGVLVLLFVAYQLWGTGLATSRAQDQLEADFRQQLSQPVSPSATAPPPTSTTPPDTAPPETGAPDPGASVPETTTTAPTGPPATAPADIPPPSVGGPVGRVEIPRIGVSWIAVQGVDLATLKKGPGHFPQTPLPGQPGNVALAGHRTTYGAPFNRLDELRPGDQITFETVQGRFTYAVDDHQGSGHFIVSPSDVGILDQGDANTVTLVACHPKYSARQRIVVTGTLTTPAAPPTPLPEVVAPPGDDTGADDPTLSDPSVDDPQVVTVDASVDALAGGDPSARTPAVLWSLAALAVWFATWWVARRWPIWHRVPAYVVGVPIFAVVLFVAYENIARLLPAAY